ncbi:MAG: hypothetical protein DRI71_11605 [Bacteroidetes bacterium]|nr:MAG: hypothetical protein DRI71_11605 [Bacteroidota bacterium]
MVEEHMKYMKDISPTIEEALRLAEESMTLSEEQMMLMEEKLERMTDELADLHISEELGRVMEMNAKVIEETMFQMQEQLADMNFEEIEEMAQFYAQDAKKMAAEAEVMAKEAKKMAAEAEKHVEAIEEFLDELNADLIKDGYIKSSKDLDQLKFKDGDVFVNGEKVKPKDAKKYIKIRDKYFDDDDDFIMN